VLKVRVKCIRKQESAYIREREKERKRERGRFNELVGSARRRAGKFFFNAFALHKYYNTLHTLTCLLIVHI
jgi:hypothetical protein